MKRIFIDANIIIGVLNKEYPLFRTGSRILSLADSREYEIYTSATCLAIAFYFASKKSGEKRALEKIQVLGKKIKISNSGQEEVIAALANPKVHDFENGIEYYSALSAKCDYIITEDTGDFYFSQIPVMKSETFLREVVLPLLSKTKKSTYT